MCSSSRICVQKLVPIKNKWFYSHRCWYCCRWLFHLTGKVGYRYDRKTSISKICNRHIYYVCQSFDLYGRRRPGFSGSKQHFFVQGSNFYYAVSCFPWLPWRGIPSGTVRLSMGYGISLSSAYSALQFSLDPSVYLLITSRIQIFFWQAGNLVLNHRWFPLLRILR